LECDWRERFKSRCPTRCDNHWNDYVPDNVDGSYLLNLQIASLKMMQVLVNPVLFNKIWGDEFRNVLRLLPSKGGRFLDEDALVFKVEGKYMLYPH
jgi:hypothetical protein